ncbi:GntR family transcriptional regulator [Primorskyibacter flagellatus]|uniref:GntR family transcriptional regulator n=1 Tax=Primorskyibacter flagellatus TaxID=1387277 RepID=A0A917EJA4_9RHOB|nr:PLP-dependent aminotransferase family protein [Primorskyibacter flagellatus]GGE50287.1 GntR family transcriptional regulator [Primorskyibacter flagellatus]
MPSPEAVPIHVDGGAGQAVAASTLFPPRAPGVPLQAWIRQSLVRAIVAGTLGQGQRMPATRSLARSLGIGRNTVTAAYEELVSLGYLDARERLGFFVARPAPPADRHVPSGVHGPTRQPAWDRHLKTVPSQMRHITKPHDWQSYRYPFIYGQVDRALFPVDRWRACSRDALGRSAIDFWAPDRAVEDDPMLVDQLCRHVLPQRGIFVRPEEVMVTLGSQEGIYILSQLLLGPGSTVAMEDPGYPDARNIFAAQRARVMGLPVDGEGLRLDAGAEAVLAQASLLFVTPAHQCPTMVSLSDDRRARLLSLADASNFLIVEDDYEGELRSHDTPPALRSIDHTGRVIYVGTMSKVLSPGVRIGYVVAAPRLIAEARAMRRLMHRSAPMNNQRTVALLLANGHYQGMVRAMRQTLTERRRVAAECVATHLPDFGPGQSLGGTGLWLTCPPDVDANSLISSAARRSVLMETGDPFVAAELNGRYIRLGISAIPTGLIAPGIGEIARAVNDLRAG